jgi:D-alanyl-D-alanine carboxypeptidase (penicillin-binding protein 5/6)
LHIAGSVEDFAGLMNERAREIGASNTNFVNPHGLHHDEHYTTAADLAMISAVAMKNPTFRKIVGSKSARFEDRAYYNKNKMLSTYDGATGIKTGYTKKAGRCLVSSSMRNGMEVVCVVLNCYDMWVKSKQLMTDAHQRYALVDLFDNVAINDVAVIGGSEESVGIKVGSNARYPLTNEEKNMFVVSSRLL